ncbi:hypothetical protein LMH73_016945 [Vibrio splendidus]|nr:hypothetical protein [Vibrio splendidus]MCC4881845.1 hypothetical protein [Vibrio splendidus]
MLSVSEHKQEDGQESCHVLKLLGLTIIFDKALWITGGLSLKYKGNQVAMLSGELLSVFQNSNYVFESELIM